MIESFKISWRQFWCSHLNPETTVKLKHGPMIETVTRCRECGKHVPPRVVFSQNWIAQKLFEGRDLPPGAEQVIFDERHKEARCLE